MANMMTSRQKKQILRVAEDELNNLKLSRDAAQSILGQGNKLKLGLKKVLAELADPILKLISHGTAIVIEALDGKETIPNAEDVFGHIDSDFKNYSADEPGNPTKETLVSVYEMNHDATFAQMFGSLSNDFGKLCLTQAQIKQFCVKHREWLRTDGYGTFFLFKSKNNFFVADVYVLSVGTLHVGVYRLERSDVWDAGIRRRVVVPQLA